MVTSDEERKGWDGGGAPPAANDLHRDESGPSEGVSNLPAGDDEALATADVGESAPQPAGEPPADAPSSDEEDAEATADEAVAGSEAIPALPEGVSDHAAGSADEDEATGRRVESLLVEAPDADPDGALPDRGREADADPAPPLEGFALNADEGEERGEAAPALTTSTPMLSIVDPSFHEPPAAPGRPLRGRGMDRVGPIVAFDFDGTLTVRDSFTAFLKWREGSGRYHAEMAALAPAALKYLFDRDPGKLKAAAIRRFLAGLPREVLNEEAMEFATVSAPLLFRPDALKAWRRYRQDGARLMIVTASPENIVAPFARGLGADMLIGTQLLFDAEDRVQGGLLGDNCRGPVKAKRIREALGQDVVLAAAYGDTDGDWEMLELAEQQFMRLFVGVPGKAPNAG